MVPLMLVVASTVQVKVVEKGEVTQAFTKEARLGCSDYTVGSNQFACIKCPLGGGISHNFSTGVL